MNPQGTVSLDTKLECCATRSPRSALLALGFRPFFLAGAAWNFVAIAIWVAYYNGVVSLPAGLSAVEWHAHEMVYGFAAAIVAGFLLTASQNWSGKPGVSGRPLVALLCLWAFARGYLLAPESLRGAVAIVDLAFFPALAWLLVPYLGGRNRVFLLILALLFTGNFTFHFVDARTGYLLGLNVLVMLTVLMAGRVIPMFTRNAVPGSSVKTPVAIERLALATAATFAFADTFFNGSLFVAAVAGLAAATHFLRLLTWRGWSARHLPILWVLHTGYLWLVLGFLLKALTYFLPIPDGSATHAFTAGGLGVIMYAMISRVSLGHTGRPIVAHPAIVFGYVLVNLAALTRVVIPIVFPGQQNWMAMVAGGAWLLAYGLLLWVYVPYWMGPRLDGKPG